MRYEYDVFGAIRSEVGTGGNPRKFTGKEYESDVKLYYYGARYYDPYTGRFTQRDPIGDGNNWYAYARNNPLRYIDPTGLRPGLVWENGRMFWNPWHVKLRQKIAEAVGFPHLAPDNHHIPPTAPIVPTGLITGEPEVPKFDSEAMAKQAVIRMLFGILSPVHEEQLQSDRGLKDEIDRQGGYGKLGEKGHGKNVRHLNGGEAEAEAMFDHLKGNRPVDTESTRTTDGRQIDVIIGTDPDGNKISYRAVSKGKGDYQGPPTIETFKKGKKGKAETKLKFVED